MWMGVCMGVCVRGRGEECGRMDRRVGFGRCRGVCVCVREVGM